MATVLAAIFVFLLVIVFHEFGHFIVAKKVGIKVHEFSIGMGPKIFHKKKDETDYYIRALPIGGYVKMEGEDENSNDPKSFNNQSVGNRMGVVAAGAIMNFILAIIVFIIFSYGAGIPTTIIRKTIKDSPAYECGIKSGDKIIKINEKEMKNWDNIVNEISGANADSDIKVTVLRNNKAIDYNLRPQKDKEQERLVIGIVPTLKRSLPLAIAGGFKTTGQILGLMFKFLGMLFTGKVNSSHLSGPVGVIHEIGEAAKYGFLNVLFITGFISVNLGFFNLLPIPALDGSRLMFLLIELIRGKPVNPEKEGFIHFIGFVFLILLMIFVTYSDITRYKLFGR
jgi:regulator of sigma E protease